MHSIHVVMHHIDQLIHIIMLISQHQLKKALLEVEELRIQRDSKDAEARRYKVRVSTHEYFTQSGVYRNSLKWSHKDEKSSAPNWKWLGSTILNPSGIIYIVL